MRPNLSILGGKLDRELRIASVSVALVLVGCPSKPNDGTPSDSQAITSHDLESDPILVGAGDIARCGFYLPWFNMPTDGESTAEILDSLFANHQHQNGIVFTAGDNAYPAGSPEDFKCYDRTWGRHKARTRPALGNHEHGTPNDLGYFSYFGAAAGEPDKGYYSYDLGSWHIIALNSMLAIQSQSEQAARAQEQWLRADLATHKTQCAIAYWHHSRFSSAKHGSQPKMKSIWQILYENGVDVVISGHDHVYERFSPQDAEGIADPEKGVRQFVVGTGGASLYGFKTPIPNSEIRYNGSHGVLKLTLHPKSYDWEFIPEKGKSFVDSGTALCH